MSKSSHIRTKGRNYAQRNDFDAAFSPISTTFSGNRSLSTELSAKFRFVQRVLRSLSHSLMWGAVLFAVLAAASTGARYYVDRRAGELSSLAQKADAEQKEQLQSEREAALRLQVEAAQREQRQATEKLSKIEKNVKGRHLTSEQSATLTTLAKQVCHSLPLVNVTASNSNHEAQVYATGFVKALKAGGCAAELALPIPGLTPDVVGIHIGVRDLRNPASGAVELSKMLNSIGITFLTSPINSTLSDSQ